VIVNRNMFLPGEDIITAVNGHRCRLRSGDGPVESRGSYNQYGVSAWGGGRPGDSSVGENFEILGRQITSFRPDFLNRTLGGEAGFDRFGLIHVGLRPLTRSLEVFGALGYCTG
jgi:hypothetical protein